MVKVKGATKAEKKVVAAAKKAKPDASVAPRAARREALQAVQSEPEVRAPTKLSAEAADLEHSIGRHPGGMEPPHTPESAKAALDAMFASADAKHDPRFDELQAGLGVRGY